jgi:hypothetical protein
MTTVTRDQMTAFSVIHSLREAAVIRRKHQLPWKSSGYEEAEAVIRGKFSDFLWATKCDPKFGETIDEQFQFYLDNVIVDDPRKKMTTV